VFVGVLKGVFGMVSCMVSWFVCGKLEVLWEVLCDKNFERGIGIAYILCVRGRRKG
jgi:hypothetical protein